jgi:UDP-N-acetylmuramoyl-L-alanyl-D-glutamate--2,6-diaminopimelate ligase
MLGVKDFTGIDTSDSRKVKPGYLFARLAGSKDRWRAHFVKDAVARGAVAVMGRPRWRDESRRWACVSFPTKIRAPAWRAMRPPFSRPARDRRRRHRHQGQVLHRRFPARDLDGAGPAGRQPWHGGRDPARKVRCRCRTPRPDPVEIHELLAKLKQDGVDHLAIEASSHGLDQHRLDGVTVSACGFTNITRDHMDYHATFEDYLGAKLRLFTEVVQDGGVAVVNADAAHAEHFIAAAKARGLKLITVGRKGDAIHLDRREDRGGAQALTLHYGGKIFYVDCRRRENSRPPMRWSRRAGDRAWRRCAKVFKRWSI